MKRFNLLLMAFILALGTQAADKVIKLLQPDANRQTLTVMQTYAQRQSTREFSTTALSMADLSDLLWAANGVNRPETGKRTAPSAMDRRDVDIYVVMPEGTYLYDATQNVLNLVTEGDLRPLVAGRQTSVQDAPVALLLVTDISKFGGHGDHDATMGAVDVGIVSQNISLFCAAAKLATVPRGSMEQEKLRAALKLTDSQQLIINHPVGYFK